jgi:membrane protease YdiL (CAAX protease family)
VVAGLFVLQYLFSLAAILITQLLVPSLGDALEGVGEGSLLLAIIGLAILPPLVEEVLFRGVLIERFAVKWRLGVAVVVSAVLFGILHVDPVGAGVFGMITGLLYLRTGSLWPGILIHGVNNLLALVAMRLAPDEEPAAVPVGETLMAAVVLLVVTVPFLIWYCRATWPREGTLTPYQRHELATGMPARTFHRAYWSQAPGQMRLEVGAMHLSVSQDIPGSAPFALLALDRVSVAYPIDVPGGQQVVVLLRDGSWTTMTVGGGLRAPTHLLADAINERCASAALGAGSSAALHN